MTKNQLIKQLQKISGNPEILVASDGEGNSLNVLDEVYAPKTLKYFKSENEIHLMEKDDIDEENITKEDYNEGKFCVVFFPP